MIDDQWKGRSFLAVVFISKCINLKEFTYLF